MGPLACTIVLAGELDTRFGASFEELTLSTADGSSRLTGELIDQAQLQGVLRRLYDLGLDVRSFTSAPIAEAG